MGSWKILKIHKIFIFDPLPRYHGPGLGLDHVFDFLVHIFLLYKNIG